MKRTIENCTMIKKHGEPEHRNNECLGFGKSEYDDEPCEVCKRCKLNTSYEETQ